MPTTRSIHEYRALNRRYAQLLPHGTPTLDHRERDRYRYHHHRRVPDGGTRFPLTLKTNDCLVLHSSKAVTKETSAVSRRGWLARSPRDWQSSARQAHRGGRAATSPPGD